MRTNSLAIAAIAVLTLAASGCSTEGDEVGDSTTTSTAVDDTTTSSTVPPSTTTDDVDASSPSDILDALAIADEDLLDGERAELREQGSQVVNQVTMDYCGHTFETERERLARHQVNVYMDDEYVASSEAVLYAAGSAEVAMNEVRQAMAECPPGVAVPSVVAGVPDMVYAATPIPDDRLGHLMPDRIAAEINVSTPEGETRTTTLIYQRRGNVLVGTYGDQQRALQLANAVAERLTAAPAADVGA